MKNSVCINATATGRGRRMNCSCMVASLHVRKHVIKTFRGLGAKLLYLPHFIKQVTIVLHQALDSIS